MICFSCFRAIRWVATSTTDGGTANGAAATVISGRCVHAVRRVSAWRTGARWCTTPSVTRAPKVSTLPAIRGNTPAGPVRAAVIIPIPNHQYFNIFLFFFKFHYLSYFFINFDYIIDLIRKYYLCNLRSD